MQQPIAEEEAEQAPTDMIGTIRETLSRPDYRRGLLLAVKIAAGVALLVLAVRGIRWSDLGMSLRPANLAWMAAAIATVLLGLGLKLWRWRLFVQNFGVKANLLKLFRAYFAGQAANIVLPFRGGELVRMGYFVDEPKNLPAVATTIALEKYLDLAALCASAVIVSMQISLDNLLNLRGFLIPITIFSTAVAVFMLVFGPKLIQKIQRNRITSGKIDWIDPWRQASQWLRNPRQLAPALILTSLIWAAMWATNLVLFWSMDLHLGGTAAGFVLIVILTGLLPALMPGNLGPVYFLGRAALLPFGIAGEQALAYAVLLHAIVTLPPLLGGALGLLVAPRQGKQR